jgi:hypothetical protein
MLTIHFDRREDHATFGPFRWHGPDAFFDLCRLLTDRGWWDEPVTFVDERGMACLTTRSLHACARRYRPNADDKAAKEGRKREAALARSQTLWPPQGAPETPPLSDDPPDQRTAHGTRRDARER